VSSGKLQASQTETNKRLSFFSLRARQTVPKFANLTTQISDVSQNQNAKQPENSTRSLNVTPTLQQSSTKSQKLLNIVAGDKNMNTTATTLTTATPIPTPTPTATAATTPTPDTTVTSPTTVTIVSNNNNNSSSEFGMLSSQQNQNRATEEPQHISRETSGHPGPSLATTESTRKLFIGNRAPPPPSSPPSKPENNLNDHIQNIKATAPVFLPMTETIAAGSTSPRAYQPRKSSLALDPQNIIDDLLVESSSLKSLSPRRIAGGANVLPRPPVSSPNLAPSNPIGGRLNTTTANTTFTTKIDQ